MQIGCIIETIGGYCPLVEGDVNLCDECGSIWLKSEHKEPIKLSDAERVILENIDKHYKWITRNEDDVLYAYIERPVKREDYWLNTATKYALHLELFSHLFQFIKFENTEPYNIEELLKVNNNVG